MVTIMKHLINKIFSSCLLAYIAISILTTAVYIGIYINKKSSYSVLYPDLLDFGQVEYLSYSLNKTTSIGSDCEYFIQNTTTKAPISLNSLSTLTDQQRKTTNFRISAVCYLSDYKDLNKISQYNPVATSLFLNDVERLKKNASDNLDKLLYPDTHIKFLNSKIQSISFQLNKLNKEYSHIVSQNKYGFNSNDTNSIQSQIYSEISALVQYESLLRNFNYDLSNRESLVSYLNKILNYVYNSEQPLSDNVSNIINLVQQKPGFYAPMYTLNFLKYKNPNAERMSDIIQVYEIKPELKPAKLVAILLIELLFVAFIRYRLFIVSFLK